MVSFLLYYALVYVYHILYCSSTQDMARVAGPNDWLFGPGDAPMGQYILAY